MFLSIHFWAILMPYIGSTFAMLFFHTEFPTYLQKALKFNVSSSGYLSSITAGVGVLATLMFGPASDVLTKRDILSIINTRKLFECLGCLGPGAMMLGTAFLDVSHANIAVILLALSGIGTFFSAAQHFVHRVNIIDFTSRFAGVMMAGTSTISCIFPLTAPLSVHWFVSDETDVNQWRVVFIIAAVCFALSAIVFVVFASADRQWWDGGSQGQVVDVEETISFVPTLHRNVPGPVNSSSPHDVRQVKQL